MTNTHRAETELDRLQEENRHLRGLLHGQKQTSDILAEEALRASKESLDLAVNGAQLGTFYCEVPFDKIIWNDTCKEHFFLPSDAEVDFSLFYSLLHPDDREPTRQAIEQAMSERVQYNVEYRVVSPEGQLRWLNAIGRVYYTAEGHPTRFDGITIDMTEKKTQERALKLLVAINDATRTLHDPEAIMETVACLLGEHLEVSRCAYAPVEEDADHFTIYGDYTNGVPSSAGQFTLTAFGPRAVAKLRGGHMYLLNNRDREATTDDNLAAFEFLQIQAIICTALIKGGKLKAMMAVHQSTPRTWTAEEIKLVELVAERSWDIIERARADKDLEEQSQEIRFLNARLKRSMTETHHRVKNNLQLIAALVEMQRQGSNDSIPVTDLLRLKQNIQALGVIHDLLTKEAKTGDTETLSVKNVLQQFLPILQATLGERRLQAEVEEVFLPGKQATSLAVVVNELVSNAVKHGKGDIEISLRAADNRVTLAVCDDGPGFAVGFDAETAANTGLELIENITRYDLRGETSYENRNEGGARIAIVFTI